MTRVIERKYGSAAAWSATGLEYPWPSAVVGVARDQNGQAMTGRDEDRAR